MASCQCRHSPRRRHQSCGAERGQTVCKCGHAPDEGARGAGAGSAPQVYRHSCAGGQGGSDGLSAHQQSEASARSLRCEPRHSILHRCTHGVCHHTARRICHRHPRRCPRPNHRRRRGEKDLCEGGVCLLIVDWLVVKIALWRNLLGLF